VVNGEQEEYHQANARPKTKTEGTPGQGKGYKAKGEKVTTTRVQAPNALLALEPKHFQRFWGMPEA